ncbi:DegV family protein [Cellulosilyticum sp. I15G10I2]|uniref:DegV family protein n=1 Tax=Cellulosilyticum sp. I15G10I2 TaxID=1892843 RepID=UPI00085CB933|nr:DegV family protein [Cellulosilyticum sp. I15G10I2]
MSEIILISDTACDLPESLINEYHIKLVPFYVSFDKETYFKEIADLSVAKFYEIMRKDKIFPKTSLPSINDYMETFMPLIEQNKNIICVCLSSHFSGSYNSAVNARELILENYPNAQIAIINSLNATGGQGLLVQEIGRMIADDIPFATIVETANKLRESARIFFFVETLDYLEHGGRIGKAAALLGTMLSVKPLIYLQDGLLFPSGKVRGTKKALAKALENTEAYVKDHANDYNYLIAHADNLEYAHIMREGLSTLLNISVPNDFSFIGVTIGVNTGPDAAGICLIKKYETFLNQ